MLAQPRVLSNETKEARQRHVEFDHIAAAHRARACRWQRDGHVRADEICEAARVALSHSVAKGVPPELRSGEPQPEAQAVLELVLEIGLRHRAHAQEVHQAFDPINSPQTVEVQLRDDACHQTGDGWAALCQLRRQAEAERDAVLAVLAQSRGAPHRKDAQRRGGGRGGRRHAPNQRVHDATQRLLPSVVALAWLETGGVLCRKVAPQVEKEGLL